MIKARNGLLAVAGLLALGLPVSPAQALNTRSFVSATNGLDTNACTRAAPCRTFVGAYAQTAVNGEINTLDPGGYGALTITHSISIVSGVGAAGVLVPSGQIGITINAGASDIINLRGLIIEGAGVGIFGIVFNTGKSLTIENSVIRNLTGEGIHFSPQASSNLVVSDTFVSNAGNVGVDVLPTGAGTVTAVFNRVEVHDCVHQGFLVSNNSSTGGSVHATAKDSVAAGNETGFWIQTTQSTPASFTLVRATAANNARGLSSTLSPGTMLIGGSTISGNAEGYHQASSGVIQSYGDNTFVDNPSNTGSLTSIVRQ